ncbi:MAG TPA: radical SAM protein [Candidatus Hydrogenedentes bacterium]|nr:radical SAM protein [Candidatus Hydrogenedentota bacterium]HPG67218.1 radical SAM protein [Candidatus Hydrogenedentota bacterium]
MSPRVPQIPRYSGPLKHRFENFGGIVASDDPPFLAFVDRALMRELGFGESSRWSTEDTRVGLLSAPTEVHLAATNRCPNRCAHCYMGAGNADAGEMDMAALKRALKALAEFGVFHVALGGGEAMMRPDLFEVAAYARDVGLVPNLTVSGARMTPDTAQAMRVFGQVNVSIDGLGAFDVFRCGAGFEAADRALDLLVAAGVPAGINSVIGRRSFDGIPALFEYAKRKGANEIEFLRLKPAARPWPAFAVERATFDQNIALTPTLAALSERHGIAAKIDCSFVPMLCWHNPPVEYLEATATYGCEAGNVLLGVRSDGSVSGCSFLRSAGLSVFDVAGAWREHPGLNRLRTWTQRAPEPCRSCAYLETCRGGCHAVAAYLVNDADSPDPDCPRVVRYRHAEDAS